MQVQTPKRVLLRGAIMNEYTGRIWRNTTGGRRYLYISPRWSSLRNQLFDTGLPQGEALSNASLLEEQTITIRLQPVFAPAGPLPECQRGSGALL